MTTGQPEATTASLASGWATAIARIVFRASE